MANVVGPRLERQAPYADVRARVCGNPATAVCAVDGVDLDVCDLCAAWIATQGRGPKVRREEAAP